VRGRLFTLWVYCGLFISHHKVAISLAILNVVVLTVITYAYFASLPQDGTPQDETRALIVSKQSSMVQDYLARHSNRSIVIRIHRWYIAANNSVYVVDNNWRMLYYQGDDNYPANCSNHFFWVVSWGTADYGVNTRIVVYIDKENFQITFVEDYSLDHFG